MVCKVRAVASRLTESGARLHIRGSARGAGMPVIGGLAAIPSRVGSLKRVVAKILPQLDHLFVTLNGFEETPAFLQARKITVFRSQEIGDLRDNAKFIPVFLVPGEFYFVTFDDDIDYAASHVACLLERIEAFNRAVVVGVHGAIYPHSSKGFRDRLVLHFASRVVADVPVSVLGTGTTAVFSSVLKDILPPFEREGMADLILAMGAKSSGVPLVCVARDSQWMREMDDHGSKASIYSETVSDSGPYDEVILESGPWGFCEIRARNAGLLLNGTPVGQLLVEFGCMIEEGVPLDQVRLPWDPRVMQLAADLGWTELLAAAVRSLFGTADLAVVASDIIFGRVAPLPDGQQAIGLLYNSHFFTEVAALAASAWRSGDRRIAATLIKSLVAIGRLDEARRVYDVESDHRSLNVIDGTVDLAIAEAFQVQGEAMPRIMQRALAAGPRGASAVALGAARRSLPWAEDAVLGVVERGLKGKWEREFLEELRGCPSVVTSTRRWVDVAQRRPGDSAKIASILLSAGRGGEQGVEGLLAEIPVRERRLWCAEAGRQRHGGTVIPALNTEFMDAALTPVATVEEAGANILSRLKPAWPAMALEAGELPLVTVIMAYHNDQSTFAYALRSVLEQTYQNIEVLVIDDCSDHVLDLPDVGGKSVRLVRHTVNGGPYACRNTGLGIANGALITTHDSDDWMHPQHIERKVLGLLERRDAAAIYTRHVRVTPKGGFAFENHGEIIGDGPMTGMFRRELFSGIGGFLEVRTRGDVEFRARIASSCGRSAVVQDEAISLLALAWHSNSKRNIDAWPKRAALSEFKRKFAREHRFLRWRAGRTMPGSVQ